MITIPKELQRPEFRFVLLGKWDEYETDENKRKGIKDIRNFYPKTKQELKEIEKTGWKAQGKIPQEKNWQTLNNYSYDSPILLNHIASGKNYGVLCGPGNLRVWDVDDLKLAQELLSKLPKTFVVKTGSGGLHIYFISDYDTNHILKNGELRCHSMQVVGPGSIHPISKEYVLIENAN